MSQFPFRNPSLPMKTRIIDLLSRLTLEEKIGWIPTLQQPVERLDIPLYFIGGEGAHGFVDRKGPSTTFPQTQGLASTWDKNLLKRIGDVIGKEARSWFNTHDRIGNLGLWFPTIDMEKDPRWGRTEEAYGEDPYLAGTLAAEIIKGAQGDHPEYLQISCAPKHFFANNNEKDRIRCSCSVDPRNMREYYLESFRRAFIEGKAASMMTAYNEVNGIPMMMHPVVRDVVKKEWGLKEQGHVVTDGADFQQTVDHHHYFNNHYETLAAGFQNGVDTMTDEADAIMEAAREALKRGLISEKEIDDHLYQTLLVRFRQGQFNPEGRCPYDSLDEEDFMHPGYQEISREAVAKSAVLLKNENHFFPLNPDDKKTILLAGPLADSNYIDWYTGIMDYQISIKTGMEERYGKEQIHYCDWRDIVSFETADGRPLQLSGDDLTLTAGNPGEEPARFYREDWGWGANLLIHTESGMLLNQDQPIADHQPTDEELVQIKRNMTLKANKTDAHNWFVTTLFSFVPQEDGLILIRSWNGPRLSAKATGVPIKMNENPKPDNNDFFRIKIHRDGLSKVREAAKEVDICLAVLGNHPLINGKEEMDRPDIDIFPPQQKLVEELYSVNPDTAGLLIYSYPVACNWMQKHLPALIYASHGMQEMGRGLTEIISGSRSPAGRLSMTWYQSVKDLPPMMEYDIISSNNTYQYFKGTPLYPFGYGLSYSSFEYTNLKQDRKILKENETLELRFQLTNKGTITADEVPQLYVSVKGSRVKRPLKTLKDYDRISLKARESREITFTLSYSELAIWDVTRERFCVEKGKCALSIGASSADIRLKGSIEIDGEVIPPRKLDSWTYAENYDDYRNCFLHEKRGEDRPAVFSRKDLDHRKSAWMLYRQVNFETETFQFEGIISSQGAAELSFHLDGADGPEIGRLELPNTGYVCAVPIDNMKPDWAFVRKELKKLSGIRDFCICIHGEAALHRFRII